MKSSKNRHSAALPVLPAAAMPMNHTQRRRLLKECRPKERSH
jgi:hypothetical protein